MSEIIEIDGQVIDLDNREDQYFYLSRQLTSRGASSKVLSVLENFYKTSWYLKQREEILALKQELKREREAVDFYADKSNWTIRGDGRTAIGAKDRGNVDGINSGGKLARSVQVQRNISLEDT